MIRRIRRRTADAGNLENTDLDEMLGNLRPDVKTHARTTRDELMQSLYSALSQVKPTSERSHPRTDVLQTMAGEIEPTLERDWWLSHTM